MTTDTKGLSGLAPARTYIHLSNVGGASAIDVDERFWETLSFRDDLLEGRILGLLHMENDSDHSEMHPSGDEILILLSGAVDVIFHEAGGDFVTPLRDLRACIVPRGVWHRVLVHAPSDMIFITPAKGTEVRYVAS